MVDLAKYKQMFIDESRQHLEEMSRSLVDLENSPQDTERINKLFRGMHSIKGMAASMSYENVKTLSHGLEDLLGKFRSGEVRIDEDVIGCTLEGVDLLEDMIGGIESSSSIQIDYTGLIEKVSAICNKEKFSEPPDTENLPSPAEEAKKDEKENVRPDPGRLRYRRPGAIKVKTEILDNLINLVGEMIIHNSSLEEINKDLSSKRLGEGLMKMDNLVKDLHLQVMKLRMMPLSLVFDMMPRIIRDLATNGGKDVELVLEGKDIELDRTIIEELGDPLIHIIRNCVDHGIEPPEKRKEMDKPERAKICLSAQRYNDEVLIEIKDDGRGIDKEKVKIKARQAGLIKEDEAAGMSDEQVYALLFHPGFSTAEKITAVSGRGVGMDAVKTKIESLGGNVEIHSKRGEGTSFILNLPLTIAIVHTFFVSVDSYMFAIPLSKILFVKDIPKVDIRTDKENNRYFVFKEEESIYLHDVRKHLHLPPLRDDKKDYLSVVTVEIKEKKTGLIVDEFVKGHKIVVKSLGNPLERLKLFSGVTVLGNGEAVLILDVERFM